VCRRPSWSQAARCGHGVLEPDSPVEFEIVTDQRQAAGKERAADLISSSAGRHGLESSSRPQARRVAIGCGLKKTALVHEQSIRQARVNRFMGLSRMKKLVLPLIALFACTTASVAAGSSQNMKLAQDACEPGTGTCCLCTTHKIGTCAVQGSANKALCYCPHHQGYMVAGTTSKCGRND